MSIKNEIYDSVRILSVKEYQYTVRAHHGVCLNFFKGSGYSSDFVGNMWEMNNKLEKNPLIRIVSQTDVICGACPNNAEGTCAAAEKVAEYDRQVLLKCGISEGEVMSFLDFEKLVRDKILLPGKREEICGNCQWNSLCQ